MGLVADGFGRSAVRRHGVIRQLGGGGRGLGRLALAAEPEDAEHAFGHNKAEYFSSAFEGFLILVAAGAIIYTAAERLLSPQPLEAVGLGLVVSVVASGVNLAVARVLRRVGAGVSLHHPGGGRPSPLDGCLDLRRCYRRGGVGLAHGLALADPVIAIAVAINILWMGWSLLKRSADGLMDVSIPAAELQAIEAILEDYEAQGSEFHALRTRQAGSRAFVMLHVLVPGDWTVQVGHDWCEGIEGDIRRRLAHAHVTTHLEPREDPLSLADQNLDRPEP